MKVSFWVSGIANSSGAPHRIFPESVDEKFEAPRNSDIMPESPKSERHAVPSSITRTLD